jgi:hypothetical protein
VAPLSGGQCLPRLSRCRDCPAAATVRCLHKPVPEGLHARLLETTASGTQTDACENTRCNTVCSVALIRADRTWPASAREATAAPAVRSPGRGSLPQAANIATMQTHQETVTIRAASMFFAESPAPVTWAAACMDGDAVDNGCSVSSVDQHRLSIGVSGTCLHAHRGLGRSDALRENAMDHCAI